VRSPRTGGRGLGAIWATAVSGRLLHAGPTGKPSALLDSYCRRPRVPHPKMHAFSDDEPGASLRFLGRQHGPKSFLAEPTLDLPGHLGDGEVPPAERRDDRLLILERTVRFQPELHPGPVAWVPC
jgi:hypothetical protein